MEVHCSLATSCTCHISMALTVALLAVPAATFSLLLTNRAAEPRNASLWVALPLASTMDVTRLPPAATAAQPETTLVGELVVPSAAACLKACSGQENCTSWSLVPPPPPPQRCGKTPIAPYCTLKGPLIGDWPLLKQPGIPPSYPRLDPDPERGSIFQAPRRVSLTAVLCGSSVSPRRQVPLTISGLTSDGIEASLQTTTAGPCHTPLLPLRGSRIAVQHASRMRTAGLGATWKRRGPLCYPQRLQGCLAACLEAHRRCNSTSQIQGWHRVSKGGGEGRTAMRSSTNGPTLTCLVVRTTRQ